MANPYSIVEKIVRIIGWTLVWLIVGGSVAVVLAIVIYRTGWWALLWVPLSLIGCAAVGVIAAFLSAAYDELASRWTLAKYNYERKHRNDRELTK